MKTGRWTKKFGGAKSFEFESGMAKEIRSDWTMEDGPLGRDRSGIVSVKIDPIPGWLEPLWTFWNGYLYLRRPEGVWKTKVCEMIWDDRPIQLLINGQYGPDRHAPLLLSMNIQEAKAWHSRANTLMTPIELDANVSVESWDVDADFCGLYLNNFLQNEEGKKVLVFAGDVFCHPPVFSLEGNYLVATDMISKEKCAFQLDGLMRIRRAVKSKVLWLRFSGTYLPAFDVQVIV